MTAKILIVEDEALIAMTLQDQLQQLGYEVCGCAASADQALAKITGANADLIVMDINLGHGMNGVELAERLRSLIDVPIIFLTAYCDAELTERVAQSESYGYLVKPYNVHALHANIEISLHRHATQRALREANRKLAQSEARHRRVTEHIADALVLDDAAGVPVFANRQFLELFGLTDVPIAEITLTDCVATRWRTQLAQRRHRCMHGDSVQPNFQYEARRQDGTTFWVESTVVPVRDDLGRVVGTQATLRDISQQKHTDEALAFLSTGTDALAGTNLFQAFAEQLSRILNADVGFVGGVTPFEPATLYAVGLSVDGAPRDASQFDLPCVPYQVDGVQYEFPCNTADSRANQGMVMYSNDSGSQCARRPAMADFGMVGCAAIGLVDSNDKLIGCLGIMRRQPIQESEEVSSILRLFAVRTAAEMERRRAAAKFENLFEFSPDAVLMVNTRGGIVLANARAEALFGYSREELGALGVDALVPTAHRGSHGSLRGNYHAHPSPRLMNLRASSLEAVRKDGTTFPVDISLNAYESDKRQLVIACIRDASERTRAAQQRTAIEAKLRHAQRVKALGTLAGGIAHDFNNLLTTITFNIALARSEVPANHGVVVQLDELTMATERATGLVRQILAFGRQQPATQTISSLPEIVQESATLLRAAMPSDITLKVHVSPDTPLVAANVTQLHQVMVNLGTNAWHAIEPRAGIVELRVEKVFLATDSDVHPELTRGQYARITVTDDGAGIDSQILETIFDPFYTTKEVGQGTGLGLSIVHGIVKEHDGVITVASKPGCGTAFRVYLPGAPIKEEYVPSPSDTADTVPEVLYVDDDKAVVRATVRLLNRMGYKASGICSPGEAIASIRANPDRFSIVITDYLMPDMDGIELARTIGEIRPKLPIILVSGNYEKTDTEVEANGIALLIHKPFRPEQLAEVLDDFLVQADGRVQTTSTETLIS